MGLPTLQPPTGLLPPMWRAVPLEAAGADGASIRIAVIVADSTDGATFVGLRTLSDGEVLLGCIISSANVVREWLEIWVQRAGLLAGTPAAARGETNNASLDERWSRLAEAAATVDATHVIPFAARPLFVDANALTLAEIAPGAVPIRDAGRLSALGLPDYRSTLHRYLECADGVVIAATEGAPTPDPVRSLDAMLKARPLLALNPEGGAMIVRRHAPLAFEGFVDYLGGASAEESLARTPLPIARSDDGDASAGGEWMFAGNGHAGRILEALHLKLCLIGDAVESVRRHVRVARSPLLNVAADAFRVSVVETGGGLPQLWTARASFAGAGDTVEINVEGAEGRYFLPLRAAGSPYRAAVATRRIEGFGMLRLRTVTADAEGGVTCEATLSSQDRIRIGKNDLLWIRIGMGRRRVDVWARVEQQSSLAAGEWRLRTLRQTLAADAAAQLKELEGQIVGEVPYELVPALGTPCDLFSLAVLAMRALLVNSRRALPAVIDDVLSLASDLRHAEGEQAAAPLAARIEQILRSDKRWTDSLGPANVMHEPGAVAAAQADAVPLALWCEALAIVVRMIPGGGPDAYRADYAEAPAGGLHRVFDAPLADWQKLAARSRSLLVLDWRANREIDAIIRSQAGNAAPAALPVAKAR